jgi:arginyl-tRNA synthetase
METFKRQIIQSIAQALGTPPDELEGEVSYPPKPEMGDLSFPCFQLAKILKTPPAAIAKDLAGKMQAPGFVENMTAAGPYLNFRVSPGAAAQAVLGEIEALGPDYGTDDWGRGRTVVVDYSSPNIAKHLAFHHIRSTMIGQVLCNLHRSQGFEVVGVNHLGDWGTTFGKLMVAVKKLASPELLDGAGISELNDLYVAFHDAEKDDPGLEEEARSWFRRLEDGDSEAVGLWKRFREISLRDFERVYAKLGVSFDHITGESFYLKRLDDVIEAAEKSGITRRSEGALIVPMDGDIPPAMLKKKDGATLYVTRDLAAALYRQEEYGFDRVLYVTDAGQSLHFRQLFQTLELMGFEWADRCTHVPFGVILMDGQRGKTREGNVILLNDVLEEAVARTRRLIEEKNPNLDGKDEVAQAVGIGAVIFNDLRNKRVKDVNFQWEDVLNFDGDTGPYVQYAHVRVHGILRKYSGDIDRVPDYGLLSTTEEKSLVLLLGRMGEALRKAVEQLEPSLLAQYLLDLASAFHRFHHRHRVISDDDKLSLARVRLVRATGRVLKNGLGLLSMEAPERM